ncbi:MAG: DUF799 family lipoprotein, partial [Nitrospirales bacterium]|nr:DUF799 family lipoprotein [Nitrospirales bacterium]
MKHRSPYIWLGLLLVLSGCASQAKPDYQKFYEHHPRTILVLPPANKTTAVDAPPIFLTTVTRPFEKRGYYVIPIYIA